MQQQLIGRIREIEILKFRPIIDHRLPILMTQEFSMRSKGAVNSLGKSQRKDLSEFKVLQVKNWEPVHHKYWPFDQ